MKKLSVVLGGRDDNYGKDFIERLLQAMEQNLSTLDKSGLDYEIIVVDFNPIDKNYLHVNEKLKGVLSHNRVKNVIIDNSVIVNENLTPSRYYEYFAKNAGIKRSEGEFIMVTNSDIIFSSELIDRIKEFYSFEDRSKHFYRVQYRRSINLGDSIDKWFIHPVAFENLDIPGLPDSCISGYCSGDATMFHRESMFNVATGYNEQNNGHRGKWRQSAMDAEILWNLHKNGVTIKFLAAPYYHIEHERPADRDGVYDTSTYRNNPEWGFSSYNETQLNHNTFIVKHEKSE